MSHILFSFVPDMLVRSIYCIVDIVFDLILVSTHKFSLIISLDLAELNLCSGVDLF